MQRSTSLFRPYQADSLLVLMAALGVVAFAPGAARADTTLTYTSANSPDQEIYFDQAEGSIFVDFKILGGSGSVTLTHGQEQTIGVGSSWINVNADMQGDSETGLTISHDFTIGGVTKTITQTDDLSGNVGNYGVVDVHAGPTFTFDLGLTGLVDVTPQEYTYDNHSHNPPVFYYTLLLRTAASPPATVTFDRGRLTYPSPAVGTVTLSQIAPSGGEYVALTSSNPAAASVPSQVYIFAGVKSATFPITTSRVDTNTPVTITAAAGGSTMTNTLTVLSRLETSFTYNLTGFPVQHLAATDNDTWVDFSVPGGSGTLALAPGIPYTVNIGAYNFMNLNVDYPGLLGVANLPIPRTFSLDGVVKPWNQTLQSLQISLDYDYDSRYSVNIPAPASQTFDLGVKGTVDVSAPGLSRTFPPASTPVPFTFLLHAAPPDLTTLHNFATKYGANPEGELTLGPDGAFYGATVQGGLHGWGTLFKIDPDGGAFTTLFTFNNTDGANPQGQKLTFDSDGSLYGTTLYGGKFREGTLFKLSAGRVLTTLHDFSGDDDGASPQSAPILGPDGNLYGTTQTSIYRVANGVFQTLHTFQGKDGFDSAAPLVVGADNALYGSTVGGGAGYGVLFRITLDGAYRVIHTFHNSDGAFPFAGLTTAPDGSLYGTTYNGGAYSLGTVFKVTPAGKFNSLHAFSDDGHGASLRDGLTLGSDGNFYGVTSFGGTSSNGTIFELTPGGNVSTLYKFHQAPDGTFPHGYSPLGGVTFGADGALYGSTYWGGRDKNGTLYRLALP